MENLIHLASVPVITALVCGAMALFKIAFNGKESLIRLIPVFAVLMGAGLGVIAFYAVNSVMPADNVLTAMLIGGASGAAATGSHQVFKQLLKGSLMVDDKDENKEGGENKDNKDFEKNN